MANPLLKLTLALCWVLAIAAQGPACAAEIYAADGLDIRWDNSLRYSIAFRPYPASAELLSYSNGDDGDRNFAPGLVSNRFDLLSALDIAAGDFGLHASAAAWYDSVYHNHTDNNSPATYNASVPAGQFAPEVKNLQGQHAELVDAFVYGNFTLAQIPVSARIGRQTVLGGESRFFDANSIAAAMAPTDYLKSMTDQNGYSGDMFLPVTQLSLTVQPLSWLSLSFYDQFEWRASRQFGDGAFLSYVDYIGTGATRLFLAPGQYLVRSPDRGPASGQYGFILRASLADMDFGLYRLTFRAKDPIAALAPDPSLAGQYGAEGYYRLAYPTGITLYGASFSTEWSGTILAGELSARQDMPLVDYDSRTPPYTVPPQLSQLSYYANYAKGDTLHAQLSLARAFAETSFWDKADVTAEIASDHILSLYGAAAGTPVYSRFGLKARGRIEPHYFQVLPNLDITGVAELGFNLAGRSFTYYAQDSGSGDFRIGISGTYLSAWKAGISYVGFAGAATRQPLANRDFVMLNLERTF
ncbi:MAG TPA: DUF1302 family protein [Rhizomicrobium sp.]|nr:DUF1302 family protein [Rhizomicrobium sp.]